MFSRPSSQKHEHAKTDASHGTHLREVKHDNPGVCLRGHGFAQLICGFALHNSALALNDGHFTYVLNGDIQHDFLTSLVLSSIVPSTLEHGQYHPFALCKMSHRFLGGAGIPRSYTAKFAVLVYFPTALLMLLIAVAIKYK